MRPAQIIHLPADIQPFVNEPSQDQQRHLEELQLTADERASLAEIISLLQISRTLQTHELSDRSLLYTKEFFGNRLLI